MPRWPKFSRELKFTNGVHVGIDAMVDHGRPVVSLYDYNGSLDDLCFSIKDAERYAKAWLGAATCARKMVAIAAANKLNATVAKKLTVHKANLKKAVKPSTFCACDYAALHMHVRGDNSGCSFAPNYSSMKSKVKK